MIKHVDHEIIEGNEKIHQGEYAFLKGNDTPVVLVA